MGIDSIESISIQSIPPLGASISACSLSAWCVSDCDLPLEKKRDANFPSHPLYNDISIFIACRLKIADRPLGPTGHAAACEMQAI